MAHVRVNLLGRGKTRRGALAPFRSSAPLHDQSIPSSRMTAALKLVNIVFSIARLRQKFTMVQSFAHYEGVFFLARRLPDGIGVPPQSAGSPEHAGARSDSSQEVKPEPELLASHLRSWSISSIPAERTNKGGPPPLTSRSHIVFAYLHFPMHQ